MKWGSSPRPAGSKLCVNDRGEFVRNRDGYDRVLSGAFENVDLVIRDDYSRVPYTFIIGISRKQLRS